MKIYNVKIKTMSDLQIENGWIEIHNGKIANIGEGHPSSISEKDIDGKGQLLIPGFVDAHTHLGIIENAISFEGDDCNEASDPFTPHVRAIDGVNPLDFCFEEAYKRGITTVVTTPGSANAVGGEMIAIKTYGRRVDDMLIRKIGVKFALGENPKTVYNDKNQTPVTRMATTAIIREGLYKAKKYYNDLTAYNNDKENLEPPEYDLKSEALIPIITRKQKAHFHCHRADDIFTAIRIANEFNLDLVLIHATEGHLIADILGRENISAIVGPIICDRSKPELKDLNEKNAGELYKNNVNICICTDHPVVPIQYLPTSAALCVKGGLQFDEALKAITINAAEIIGIADKVGSIEIGKDADLQLYNTDNPLDILSEPTLVMINGKIIKQ
ncbi:MAG: amidohydrolase [Clostridiales bacterium]|jgi:imidazolonepropionase-like amidohydrolase|nr:amidohydrolase [Clostridiales bacterium]